MGDSYLAIRKRHLCMCKFARDRWIWRCWRLHSPPRKSSHKLPSRGPEQRRSGQRWRRSVRGNWCYEWQGIRMISTSRWATASRIQSGERQMTLTCYRSAEKNSDLFNDTQGLSTELCFLRLRQIYLKTRRVCQLNSFFVFAAPW